MNWITNNSIYLCKTISTTIIRAQIKNNSIGSNKIFKQFYYENKRLLHTATILSAGHSKWANIKSTKSAKDQAKSMIFSKLSTSLKIACKAGGSPNPKFNLQLAKVVEQARNANMPQANIDRALKVAETQSENAKPGNMNAFGPGGMAIVIDVFTDNMNRTHAQVRNLLKKANLKHVKGSNVDGIFYEKGFILTKGGDLNKAMEDAIEVGAEDVMEEDGMLRFICESSEFLKVRNLIERRNYDIEYSNVDKIPYSLISVDDVADTVKLQAALDRIEEHEDVVKIFCNFEL